MESLCCAKSYYFMKNASFSQQNAAFCYQKAGSKK